MPNGLSALDVGLPHFTGRETAEQKLAAIQNYLYMLLESLRYTLANLDTSNWNKTALDEFVEMIRAGVVVAEKMISNTVITQNLYATYGDIAELTVDRLMSGDKVERYLHSDISDVNYIKIQDQTISFITGSTDGSRTEQLTNRNGDPMYWKGPVTPETYTEVGMAAEATAYPVTVYQYAEQIKMKISFEYDADTGYYIPKMTLGVGTAGGDSPLGRGYIWKDPTGITLRYTKSNGTNVDFHIGEDGITGLSTDSNDVKLGVQLASVANAAEMTVASEEMILGAVGISVASNNDVPVYVSLTVTPSDATHAKMKVYIDGSLKLTRKFVLYSADEQNLCCTGIIDSIAAGNHTLTFKAVADDANMAVAGAGFLGYAIIPGSAYQSYAEGLIAYYELDDATDSGSLGMDLTAYGSITYAEGKVGNCAVFNGSSWFYIQNTMLTEIFWDNNSYSVTGWFKTTTTTGLTSIVAVNSGSDTYKLGLNDPSNNGKLNFNRENGLTPEYWSVLRSNNAYNDGQWHMFVTIYDGETMTLNVDNGSEIVSMESSRKTNHSTSLRVGSSDYQADGPSDSNGRDYDGCVDQLRFYNYAISPAEIADLWNGGAGK